MAEYLSTDNVNVFPSTYRTKVITGKLTSEQNFINIINSITDMDSYVLDYEQDEENTIVKSVVIHGYLFTFNTPIIVKDKNSNKTIWLGIQIETTSGYGLINYLDSSKTLDEKNQEEEWEFRGLRYSDDGSLQNNPSIGKYSLQISENGEIKNKVRLKTDSIEYNSNNDLTSALTKKQDKLKTDSENYITIGKDGEELDLTEKTIKLNENATKVLDSVKNGVGKGKDAGKLIYFESYEAKESEAKIGGIEDITREGSIIGKSYTSTYLNTGTVTKLNTIHISTGDPESSDGRDGDIWLKYSDSSN